MSAKAARTCSADRANTPEVPIGISIIGSQLRSTNLERDVQADSLPPLYVGVRAQDTLNRLTAALEDLARTRAWSLTGPYGSGKSSLALLLDALLGPDGQTRRQADQLVAAANTALIERLSKVRSLRAPHGFLRAVATARREPLGATLARALRTAAPRHWPHGQIPKRITSVLKPLHEEEVSSARLLDAIEAFCTDEPVLLVIDEFGKTLEYLGGRGDLPDANDDLFLLQELAELGAGKNGLPLYILTLQHLSFLDYASHSTALQRREWAKIQGRFEDISFSPDLNDAVQLIGRCLDHAAVPAAGRQLIHRHAEAAGKAWSERGLGGVLAGDAQRFAALYPLHPLTVVAAPLLAAQVGQHDRSLTGFLTSDEPHTVQRFLTTYATKAPTRANTVRLSQLYDYFLASGRTTVLASANASRWIEIDTRISEAHGLPDIDLEILKTIGLLNLIDSAGALRASPDMVLFALTDPVRCTDESARKKLLAQLNHLVDRGFLVFREFSDEYRLWQGSDVDLRGRLDELRERCDDHAVVKLLARNLPSAVVAGRHSQLTGMLRHFITTASESDTGTISGPQIEDPADGLLIFHFGDERNLPAVTSPLPVAIGISARADTVLEAGRYLLALQELLEDATLDAVARREVTERLGQARAMLATELTEAFVPGRSGTRWQLLIPDDDAATARVLGDPLPARSLAGVVSAACEEAYPYTPRIRNEMLGRHQLTSQGAKARRELLTAMVTHPDEEYLGISGYGPERAMYSGVLGYLGLHQPMQDAAGVGAASLLPFGYAEPGPECSLHPAWRELSRTLAGATQEISLDRVFRLLLARPYGIKAGVVPVMVVAALLLHAEDVALFEEGSYQPQLMPELIERLVKAPQRFTFKAVPASTGQRRLVLDKLSQLLEVNLRARPRSAMRNPALLSVTQALLDHVRTLTPYAMRTRRISSAAVAVRDALVSARDPDALVFTALPAALGMRPIKPQAPRDEAAAEAFAVHTADALKEIQTATDDLRSETVKIIARAFRLPQDLRTLRSDLAARARGFADALLEPSLKGLIALALNDSLSDDWIDPVIIRIAGTALNDWTDEKAEHFPVQAQALADALDRVSHLYQAARLDADAHPFDAQLITLTSADGSENRTMVYVPHAARETATKFAATILDQAEGELGPDGGRILLAALTQSLIATDAPKVIDESDPPRNLKRVIQ